MVARQEERWKRVLVNLSSFPAFPCLHITSSHYLFGGQFSKIHEKNGEKSGDVCESVGGDAGFNVVREDKGHRI